VCGVQRLGNASVYLAAAPSRTNTNGAQKAGVRLAGVAAVDHAEHRAAQSLGTPHEPLLISATADHGRRDVARAAEWLEAAGP
jgi:hypothetical protein